MSGLKGLPGKGGTQAILPKKEKSAGEGKKSYFVLKAGGAGSKRGRQTSRGSKKTLSEKRIRKKKKTSEVHARGLSNKER